jgi:N-acetylmuramoyl-L-alanine amidase
MKGFLTALFCLCLFALHATDDNAPYFFSVTAKPGDGITVLLNRYDLDEHPCNLDKFLELNKLSRNDFLLAGMKYKIPVLIYTYNGTSIRSTLGIDDLEKAKRIANYNRVIMNRNLRRSTYEASKILWVPFHELNCEVDKKSVVTRTDKKEEPTGKYAIETVPLFGKEYEVIEKKSNRLKGKVYYITSGHGGPDPGALAKIGNRNICEDEYAYDVSLRLARNLMENGATVHVVIQDDNDGIRNEDILLCDKDEKTMGEQIIPINQLARLKQRTTAINELYGQYVRQGIKEQYLVCIHVDSRSESTRQDVFFYHFEHSKSGSKLAKTMQDVFSEKYARYRSNGEYFGSVSTRNLYMLRVPYPTTLYVELANIKNEADRKRILPSTNRQALANWLYEGLAK